MPMLDQLLLGQDHATLPARHNLHLVFRTLAASMASDTASRTFATNSAFRALRVAFRVAISEWDWMRWMITRGSEGSCRWTDATSVSWR